MGSYRARTRCRILGRRVVNVDDVPRDARAQCRSCKAECIWTVTDKQDDMLVDLVPGGYATTDHNGQTKTTAANLALTVVNGVVHSRVVKPHLAFGNRHLHLSHFVRCPQSKFWRKSGTNKRTGSR